MTDFTRRSALATGAFLAACTAAPVRPAGASPTPRLKFGVIGINHGHIYNQCDAVIRGGGQLTKFYAKEDDLALQFMARYPNVQRVSDERAVLEDDGIKLVISAAIPVDRAEIGIRVMQHGKDYMADKPGIITLDQLARVRKVQAETGRIYSITYSERLENHATVKASELVAAGAIGDVVQTAGFGPHRMRPETRPDWFWDPAKYGGIITDIGAHQMDQFLHFTGSTHAEVTAAQIANFHNQDHPDFQDFGDAMMRGNGGAGYFRLDWFTPDGLPVFGDGRLTIIGSDGYIEVRKYIDLAGRPGGSHLYLIDHSGIRHVDCGDVDLPYGRQVIDDVLNRTETAMTQAHCFLATELALKAQAMAVRADKLPD